MEMEDEANYRAHVMVLSFPGQGHMNPMFQFSKRLSSEGIKITVATTLSTTKTMPATVESINLESIFDDLATENRIDKSGGYMDFIKKFEASCRRNVPDIVKKHESSKNPIKCLVYDGDLQWCLDIAKQLGITAAAFYTQSCAAIVTYLQLMQEYSNESTQASVPGLLPFRVPTVTNCPCPDAGQIPPILQHIFNHYSNIDKTDMMLFNSFDKLEEEAIKDLSKIYPVNTIGPTLPSIYLDKRVIDDKEYGFNLFKPDGDVCMKWLNTKQRGSVVYVSFGSAAQMREVQMEEIAWGLKKSDRNFLWVVRTMEQKKLPNKFKEETSEKGLVVTWCPQLEVLSHQAVGCFVTHCGWNSTIEGVSLGVPMLAMPQYLDQFSDAKFVEEVWRVGLTPKADEKGIVRREEIQVCIREIMEGMKGEEIKKNAKKWKELAKEAIDEGGSSDKHIEEFIGRLVY